MSLSHAPMFKIIFPYVKEVTISLSHAPVFKIKENTFHNCLHQLYGTSPLGSTQAFCASISIDPTLRHC
jgi:hypothetical protein